MKILQVNCVYKKGSTGKITYDLHKALKDNGIESVVCYGRGEKVNETNVYKTCSELYSKVNQSFARISGVLYGGCFISTNKLISVIEKEKPDIVHLQCINGYFVNIYRLINWLKHKRIQTVLTLHAEFIHTANCGYALDCEKWKTGCGNCPRIREEIGALFFDNTHTSWNKMKNAFDGFENLTVVSVSPWLMERAKSSPILSNKNHAVIMNGLDIEIFKPYNTDELKKELGIENKKIIFHATPNFNNNPNHIKGGYYVLKLAERLKDSDTVFIIAGCYPEGLKTPENVILLGNVKNQQKLACLYSMADVTLLTSKRETFSMICAESLCCGTRVVGFKAGGPETIALPQYSTFVDYGDVDALEKAVTDCFKNEKNDCIFEEAASKYSKDVMMQNYISVYRKQFLGV